MLDGLREWVEEEGALARCFDRFFLSECMTFRMQHDGKFGADPGCHDDAVVKWAIANQMRVADWRRKRMRVASNVSRWNA